MELKSLTRHFNSDSPPRRLLCAAISLRSIIAQSNHRSGLPVKCGVRQIGGVKLEIAADKNFSEWAKSFSGCDGGNISGSIWFCGIEFGGNDELLNFQEISAPPYVNEEFRGRFKTYQYNWKVLKIYSTLVGYDPSKYKKVYAASRAFDKESDTFKMNLYPIAFRNVSDDLWSEHHYRSTGLPTKPLYQAWCQIERFPIIKSWVSNNKPKVIVCTGTTYLREFVMAFCGIENVFCKLEEQSLDGGNLFWTIINDGETALFVTPFLGQGGLKSDAQIECHALKMKELCDEKLGDEWCKPVCIDA